MLHLIPLLAALTVPPLQDPPAPKAEVPTVKESESGHRYAVECQVLGGDAALALTGTGIREKTILAVNVYSFGLYIEPKKAAELLAKWRGKKVKELQKDEEFYAALVDDSLTKELRIVFCRDVAAEDVRSAFEDSLQPRLLAFLKDEPGTKEQKLTVLEQFRKLFTLDKVKDGNVLRFAWHPGGKLHTSINGEVQPVIESKALCWALFDVYVGKKPISEGGRKRLVERIPDLLSPPAAPAPKK